MSDMNLPTVTFDAHPGELYLDDLYEAVDRVVSGRRYALVPVDAMERVWWCGHDGQIIYDETDIEDCQGLTADLLGEGSGWRWLVSAKEDER